MDLIGAREVRDGSSPRVRGKRRRWIRGRGAPRLIPARAGKTILDELALHEGRAHPRACGENMWARAFGLAYVGSSPRVRGKPTHRTRRAADSGLIPARAGKTAISPACCASTPAHPRACGENSCEVTGRTPSEGSSPRVRGKRASVRFLCSADRLIPARAGKTSCARRRLSASRAHPRACGENPMGWGVGAAACGSSPRVRGKH